MSVSSLAVSKRGLVVVTAVIAALLLARPYAYKRWIGESPTYPLCVAAMDAVIAGQSRIEAESRIAEAVTAGAGRWEPGPDVLARHPQSRIPVEPSRTSGYVEVTCRRYDPDEGVADLERRGRIIGSLRLWAQMHWNGGFNATRYELMVADDRVRTVQAFDCASAPIDTMDCREHEAPEIR